LKIIRAYKTELDLNNEQRTACAKHAGAARYAYNWGLGRKKQAYVSGEKTPSAIDLHRELNILKKGELGWMYEVSKCAPQEALRNLDVAYANFFRRAKNKKARQNGRCGFPKFKSRKNGLGSFRLTGTIRVFDRHIQLPRLGKLKLKEAGYLQAEGVRILSATVSEKAGRWFVSIQCEVNIPDLQPGNKPVCGVDLGIKTMAVVSDGMMFENPKSLKRNLTKIKRIQRVVSRRKKGSQNRKKAVAQLAKVHAKVANIRKDSLHQATSLLAKNKSAVVLENLNVSGMMRNHRLAQAISDVGVHEFKRQMQYKGEWYGCEVLFADRFYPSSKTCSNCGTIKSALRLGDRTYYCEACGYEIDRDLNAAINLENLYFSTASSAGSNACGEDGRPASLQADLEEAGIKQQTTNTYVCVGF
jgi:putative transposase